MTADPSQSSRALEKAFVSLVADALRQGNLTVVVGAGVSKAAGLPSWSELASTLAEELQVRYEEALPSEPIRIAELYKRSFGPHRLQQAVCDALRSVAEPSDCHLALAELGPSVHYFTTNYDSLLETALRRLFGEPAVQVIVSDVETDFIKPDLIPVYKLAGSLDRPGSMSIARSDYLIYRQLHARIISRFIDELRSRTTVFVGSSLLDPTVEYCLAEAFGQTLGQGRRAFVVLDAATGSEQDYLESVGLQPVVLGDYGRLPSLLLEARQAALVAPARVAAATRQVESGRSADVVQRAYAAASGTLEDQLRQIRQRFDLGAGSAVCLDIDSLLQRVAELPPDARGTLETRACLLAARAAIRERGGNHDRVQSYLRRAEQAGLAGFEDEHRIVTAMLLYASGQTDEALNLLQDISSDWAVRTRFAINLAAGRTVTCRRILDELGPDSGALGSESGHRLVALLYLQESRFTDAAREAKAALSVGRRGPARQASAQALEAAGMAHAAAASQRLRDLANRHHLVLEFLIEVDASSLIDRALALEAAGYFRDAAATFESLGNQHEAIRCCLQAYALLAEDVEEQHQGEAVAEYVRGLDVCVSISDLAAQQADAEALDRLDALSLDVRLQDALLRLLLREREDEAERLREKLAESILLHAEEVPLRLSAAHTLLEVYAKRSDIDRAAELAATMVLPREYAYLQQVFAYMAGQARGDRRLAGAALRAALDLAPRNPSVLLLVLRRNADLLREGGETEWRAKCWQLSRVLIEELPTAEAYDQFAYWGLQAGEYQEVLAALETPEAEAAFARWQLQAWRGQALGLLGRSTEARDAMADALRHEPPAKPLGPPFFLELTRLYVETGERQKAVAVASDARSRFPNDVGVLMAEVAAYEESGDLERAYSLAKDAAARYSDDEYVQARWIQLGFSTRHADETAEALARFVERWPESKIWRRFDLHEGVRLIQDMQRRADHLFTLYEQGTAPIIALCHAAPGSLAYFQFWTDRWDVKAPLFATRGLDAGLADRWVSEQRLPSFVIDYTAALTLWRLFGDDWATRLGSLDWALVDLTLILNAERRQLSTRHLDHYHRRIEHVADWVEEGLRSGRLHEIPGGYEADEARFALERKGLARLTLAEADVPSGTSFGIRDVATLLQAAGITSAEQTKLLAKYGRRIASDAVLGAVLGRREFVVDDQVLDSIAELGELQWLTDLGASVWIGKQSVERARARRLQVSRLRDVADSFEAFCRSAEGIQQRSRDRVLPCDRRADEADRDATFTYARSLIETCQATERSLLTDDHFFHRGIESAGERSFGSSTLLRLLFLQGALTEQDYCQLLDHLLIHGYRWVPPETEHIYHLLALDPDSPAGQTALETTRDYLRGAMGAANRRELPPAVSHRARSVVFRYARGVLPDALLRAHEDGIDEERVAAFVSLWAPDRLLLGSGLQATAFLTLVVNRCFQLPRGSGRRAAIAWLDRVLLASAYTEADIDITWASLVGHMMKFSPDGIPREAAYLMAVELLNDLPERTRASVHASKTGEQLRSVLGEPDTVTQVMRVDESGERAVLRIAERDLQRHADHLLVARTQGRREIATDDGLVLRLEETATPDWFAPIRGYVRSAGQDHRVPGLDRWTDWYRQLTSETAAVRSYAWQRVLDVARSLGVGGTHIPALEEELLTAGETGARAGQQAQTFVRRNLPLFAGLLDQYITHGHAGGINPLLSALDLSDALAWLPVPREADRDRSSIIKRAMSAAARSFDEESLVLDSDGLDHLLRVSRAFGGSLFTDGALFVRRAANAVIGVPDSSARKAQFVAGWLYRIREELAVQRVWLNCALAAMRVAAAENLWQEKVKNPRQPSVVRPLGALVRDTFNDAIERRQLEMDSPVLLVSATAKKFESILGLNWLAEGGDPETCRYTAALGSMLLAVSLESLRLRQLGDARGPIEAMDLALAKQARDGLFRQVALHRALPSARYRSEWVAFVPFELEYLGKHGDPGELQALMSDELRRSLLELGIAHKCTCDLLGLPNATAMLDSEFCATSDAGVVSLLTAGDDPKRWLAEDQDRLEALRTELPSGWFLELWQDKGKHDDAQLLNFVNAFMYGATSAGAVWLDRAHDLLGQTVLARAKDSLPLFSMLTGVAALAVMAKPSRSAKLLRWLTPRPSTLTASAASDISEAVGSLVWANAQSDRPSRVIERSCRDWLCAVLRAPALDGAIKRRVLQAIGRDIWGALPDAFRSEVRRAMDEIRADPGVRSWLEWEHYGFLPQAGGATDGEG